MSREPIALSTPLPLQSPIRIQQLATLQQLFPINPCEQRTHVSITFQPVLSSQLQARIKNDYYELLRKLPPNERLVVHSQYNGPPVICYKKTKNISDILCSTKTPLCEQYEA